MESSNSGKDTGVPSRPVVSISLSVSQTLSRRCSLSIKTPAANRLGFIVPAHHRRQPHPHRPHRHRPPPPPPPPAPPPPPPARPPPPRTPPPPPPRRPPPRRSHR